MSLEKDTVIMPLPEGSETEIKRKIYSLSMHNLFRTATIIFLLPEGKDKRCSKALEAGRIAQEIGMEPMFVTAVPQPFVSNETGPLGWGYFSIPAKLEDALAWKYRDDPIWPSGEYIPIPKEMVENAKTLQEKVIRKISSVDPVRILPFLTTLANVMEEEK